MYDTKIPAAAGDSWAHAGPEYPVTTATIAALDPKIPAFVGDAWHPTASIVTAHGGVPVASGALNGPKLPPYQGG
jgi:hypothetical protein